MENNIMLLIWRLKIIKILVFHKLANAPEFYLLECNCFEYVYVLGKGVILEAASKIYMKILSKQKHLKIF